MWINWLTFTALPLRKFRRKHSFSFTITRLMVSLLVKVGDTQTIAISIAFQAAITLKSQWKFLSTILWISPRASMILIHWFMWVFSLWDLSITSQLVIISKRIIPKLQISLFSVNLYEMEYLNANACHNFIIYQCDKFNFQVIHSH